MFGGVSVSGVVGQILGIGSFLLLKLVLRLDSMAEDGGSTRRCTYGRPWCNWRCELVPLVQLLWLWLLWSSSAEC